MAKKIPFIFGTFNMDGLSHSQRVCRLYKQTLQHVWSYQWNSIETERRDALRVRYLLNKNRDVKDPRKQKKLYEEWVGLFEKYKHAEPIIHPECPDGTAYNRQVYISKAATIAPPMESWHIKEWQLENNISGLKEWEWDKRPAWRDLVVNNHKRSHLIGYEDDV